MLTMKFKIHPVQHLDRELFDRCFLMVGDDVIEHKFLTLTIKTTMQDYQINAAALKML